MEPTNSCPAPGAPGKALPPQTLPQMVETARQLRRHIITMLGQAGSGHPGGSLSAVEIVTALFFHDMRHDPSFPCWPERDRFILSKGHAAPVLYAALAEAGYFPAADLLTLRRLDSRLQGHCDMTFTSGVDMSAGALGQGLSFSIGTALSARISKQTYHTYTLMGDGECDEGQVWEAAMAAAHFKVDNLTAIVDNNGLQIDGPNSVVMSLAPFRQKWEAFGWHVIEVDGHNLSQLLDAFAAARKIKGQPSLVLAHTVKGKGVSFMENKVEYHGKVPGAAEIAAALKELA